MDGPQLRYREKVALVTGSRRGVGRVIAEHFLAEGGTCIGFSRGPATFEHANYRHYQVDVADSAAVLAAFDALRASVPALHIVVNNAAVLTSQYAMIMPAAAAQSMVATNLLGTFYVSREAVKLMRKGRWGRIVNISSMAVRLEPAGDSVYAACKAGVSTLANIMAKEFAAMNITCNTLAITAFESDMLDQIPRAKIDAIVQSLPLPRFASSDDIVNVIDFFASERSSYVTAQTVYLGGVT